MSQLLNGLLSSSSSRQSDEHGVADLLEAVSRRSMSCTDEEKQEIFDMVKRVREHNHKPNAVESIQRKLSSIHVGLTVNNNNSTEPNHSDPASPNRTKPNFVGVPSIGVPLNNLGKDIARGISILQNQLSPSKILSPLAERVDRESRRKQPMQQQKEHQEQNDHPPGLLRGFIVGVTPTIAILPPFEDEPRVKVTQEGQQQHESSSIPESDELYSDKGGEGGDVDESDQGVDQALREEEKKQDH
jgi:hypothetical protein